MSLVFVRDDILFRRFSTTNQINSCGFESGVIWGKRRRKMRCLGIEKHFVGDCLRVDM